MILPAHSTSKLDDERERAPAGVAQSAKWQALPSPAHARGFCCVPLALRGSPQPCTGHPARQTPSRAATSQERCSPHGDARALPRGVAHEASARAALGAATGATHGSARVRTCMAAGAAGVRYSAAGGQRRVGSSGRAGSSGKMRGRLVMNNPHHLLSRGIDWPMSRSHLRKRLPARLRSLRPWGPSWRTVHA